MRYFVKIVFFKEYKTEVNDNNLLYEGEGLLLKITNIEDTRKKKIDTY